MGPTIEPEVPDQKRKEAGSSAPGEPHSNTLPDQPLDGNQPASGSVGQSSREESGAIPQEGGGLKPTEGAPVTPPPPANGDQRRQRRQSTSVVFLAVLAGLFAVYFARPILLPVVIAVILTLLLRPLVRRCRRLHIPDAGSAAAAVLGLVLFVGIGVVYLVGPARAWVSRAPSDLQIVGEKLRVVRDEIEEISKASSRMRAIAEGNDVPAKSEQSILEETLDERMSDGEPDADEIEEPIAVEVREPTLSTGLSVLSITGGFFAGVVITLVLTYFLLATGDRLLNNVLHVLPTFREKRTVVEMVYEVETGVSSYLLTVTLINIGLGVAIGSAMWLLGLPNAALWGAMATLLNFIPYLGAMTGTVVVFLVAVLTFDSLAYAALVPVVYFSLTALEGNVVTPSLLGRKMSLNPIVLFLSLIFWGWMWGVGGALIAVPLLMILKVAFDQFERTRALGTLLGG